MKDPDLLIKVNLSIMADLMAGVSILAGKTS